MNTIITALKSRTVWVIAALFVFNGLKSIEPMIGGTAHDIINTALSVLAIYFKMNPSQNYGTPEV